MSKIIDALTEVVLNDYLKNEEEEARLEGLTDEER